jgi:hypothetical protein
LPKETEVQKEVRQEEPSKNNASSTNSSESSQATSYNLRRKTKKKVPLQP